jgi:hypothetical protein
MGQHHNPADDLVLTVVDQAYGDFADLYSDVLRVSVVATHEQIQLAYFDRRSELFTLLAKIDSKPQYEQAASERFLSERKMDSVVLAVRILGDEQQRLRYDRMRQQRLLNRRRAEHGQLPGHEANQRVSSGLDSVAEDDHHNQRQKEKRRQKKEKSRRPATPQQEELEPQHAPSDKEKRKKKNSKEKKRRKDDSEVDPKIDDQEVIANGSDDTQDTDINLTDDDSLRDDRDRSLGQTDTDDMREDDVGGATCLNGYTSCDPATQEEGENRSGMLSCFSNSRVIKNISDEISGACEDTMVSVDQVFNAFTLTDKDIRAVTKRIDKAKKQLDT